MPMQVFQVYREYTVAKTDVKKQNVYQKFTKKAGGGLEFQGLAVPSVFACLPNVYHVNFLGVISGIFPLIFPFL